MKNTLNILLAVLFLTACTKDISRFNVETKKPAAVPGATLFSNAVRNLADDLVGNTTLRLTVKHWAVSIYQDEARYNFTTARITENWWTGLYQDDLNNLQGARTAISSSNIEEAQKNNQLAIIDLLEVYIYHVLTSSFGNIPYSEALNAEQLFPKYDDAATIYADLLNRIDADINLLNPDALGFETAQDLIYAGNMSKWIKFAHSLKIKVAMTLVDVDENTARTALESSATLAFTSSEDDAKVVYPGVSPNINPLYQTLILSLRTDFVSAMDLLDELVRLEDPRLAHYYRPNNSGAYVGGIVGSQNTFSDVAKPSYQVSDPASPSVFIDYAEIEFYLAEAKARNFNVAGSVADHYQQAIRASIQSWGGSESEALSYLQQAAVAYETAPGDWREKIGFQKWIALYNRPFDAWLELRRFDYPKLSPPVGAFSGFPNRFTYPPNEQQLNNANYTAASAAIGGDKVETKLFWDKY